MGYSIRARRTVAAPTRLLRVVFGIGFLLAGLVPLSSQDLSIEQLTNYMDGNWLVAGTVITHDSGQTRRFVNVAILGFDDDGELVVVEETYPNSSTLAAGATSVVDFLITPRLSRQVDRYRVLAYSGD
ncbi:MAG: hypothetical protein GVY29_03700 [Spirochaetes bacterium]|jgi:hypothetical protein|nr:hypothetical protein [Spirochaetota bacterium]